MSKVRLNEEEKQLIASFNVSQNESNKGLIGQPKEGNIFNILNENKTKNKKPSNKDLPHDNMMNSLHQNTQNFLKKTISKSFKEDERDDQDDADADAQREDEAKGEEKTNKHLSVQERDNDHDHDHDHDHDQAKESKSNSEENDSNLLPTPKDEEDANRQLFRKEKICDTDTEDEESGNEKEVTWVILPDNSYKRTWDLLIALIILYSSIMTPYEIAFLDKSKDSPLDHVITAFLALDMILSFFSAFTDSEENLVKNRKKIALSYLKSWFIVDLISVIPINEMTTSSFTYNKITRISRLPKLYRLVKLTKLLRITKMSGEGNVNKIAKYFLEKLKINANIERLLFFILTFLILNHLCACFWYFMARLEEFSPDSWVVRLGYVDNSNFELYIISFYWTLTTVTTVGYGDVNAGTTIERVYNLFIMSFGVLLYSFAIGSLSSIVATLDQKTAEMNQKLRILSSIKKEFNLDQEIYDKVRKVIKFDLSRNQRDKMTFLQELPNKLRIELSQIMHDKVIQNLYFFRDQPNDFFAYVAPLLKPVKFSQNDYLYKCQDMIDEMYFVTKGTVIFCLDKNFGEREIKEIKKNNNFGEIEMCLNEKLSFNIKIKSRNCELYVLKKNDFLRLSVNFKEFIENFLHKSLMKYLKFTEEKNKMIREFEQLMNKCGDNNSNRMASVNKNLQAIEEEKDEADVEISNGDEEEEHNSESSNSNANNNNNNNCNNNKEAKKDKDKDNDEENKSNIKKPRASIVGSLNPTKTKDENHQTNSIDDDNVDKFNKQLNNKFIKKIDKIVEYLNKKNYQFKSVDRNPKEILLQLKNEDNLVKKNELIDQIEGILKEFYESNKKGNSMDSQKRNED